MLGTRRLFVLIIFIFMQFLAKNVPNNRLAHHPLGLAPSLKYPGSATNPLISWSDALDLTVKLCLTVGYSLKLSLTSWATPDSTLFLLNIGNIDNVFDNPNKVITD